jgi:ornithine cyclodeaminase/alanine dehydrogenase-like protein (mu-crystallin family)
MDGSKLEAGPETLVLTGGDIGALMGLGDYRDAVEAAFIASAKGLGLAPSPMHVAGDGGGFHVKGAGFPAGVLGPRAYAAFKINGNFPDNPKKNGRPTIQGVIVLCDGRNGRVLALMDSIEITLQRTAAASAVAARKLARPGSRRIAILGCGAQAWPQLQALSDVLPIAEGFAWDREPSKAQALSSRALGADIELSATTDLAEATRNADVIVTCTTARAPFLGPEHVKPGAFIAAVGADAPEKHEIHPDLFRHATVVADVAAQALSMGDSHHAVAAGAMPADGLHAELAEVIAGLRPGRMSAKEITLFDSTGVAIQDVASAARVYELALARGLGARVALAPSDGRR